MLSRVNINTFEGVNVQFELNLTICIFVKHHPEQPCIHHHVLLVLTITPNSDKSRKAYNHIFQILSL